MDLTEVVNELNTVANGVISDVSELIKKFQEEKTPPETTAEVVALEGVANNLTKLAEEIKKAIGVTPVVTASTMAEPTTPAPENPVPEGQLVNPS